MSKKIYNKNNIFNQIATKAIKTKIIFENQYAMSFFDINPQAKIHALVIPKGNYLEFSDFANNASDSEIHGLFSCIKTTIDILKIKNGFRLISNSMNFGKQEVFHLHFHILSGDEGQLTQDLLNIVTEDKRNLYISMIEFTFYRFFIIAAISYIPPFKFFCDPYFLLIYAISYCTLYFKQFLVGFLLGSAFFLIKHLENYVRFLSLYNIGIFFFIFICTIVYAFLSCFMLNGQIKKENIFKIAVFFSPLIVFNGLFLVVLGGLLCLNQLYHHKKSIFMGLFVISMGYVFKEIIGVWIADFQSIASYIGVMVVIFIISFLMSQISEYQTAKNTLFKQNSITLFKENIVYKIATKKIPQSFIYEDDHAVSYFAHNPQSKIHVIIIPKLPYIDFYELMVDDIIIDFIRAVGNTITELKIQDGFKIVSNNGFFANDNIRFCHFHIMANK